LVVRLATSNWQLAAGTWLLAECVSYMDLIVPMLEIAVFLCEVLRDLREIFYFPQIPQIKSENFINEMVVNSQTIY